MNSFVNRDVIHNEILPNCTLRKIHKTRFRSQLAVELALAIEARCAILVYRMNSVYIFYANFGLCSAIGFSGSPEVFPIKCSTRTRSEKCNKLQTINCISDWNRCVQSEFCWRRRNSTEMKCQKETDNKLHEFRWNEWNTHATSHSYAL